MMFKNTYELLEGYCVRNFKRNLWHSTQNMLPVDALKDVIFIHSKKNWEHLDWETMNVFETTNNLLTLRVNQHGFMMFVIK